MGQTNNDMRIGTRSRSGAHEGAGWDSSPGPLERKRGMLLKIVSIFTAVCVCFAIQCSIKNTDNMSWLIAGHFFYLPRYDTATEEGTSDRPADRASEDCSQKSALGEELHPFVGWAADEELNHFLYCRHVSHRHLIHTIEDFTASRSDFREAQLEVNQPCWNKEEPLNWSFPYGASLNHCWTSTSPGRIHTLTNINHRHGYTTKQPNTMNTQQALCPLPSIAW